MKRIVSLIFFMALFFSQISFAALSLELTQGMSAAMPIGLAPFTNEVAATVPGNTTLSNVIHDDLQNSGEFRVVEPTTLDGPMNSASWQKKGVNNLIQGTVTALANGSYQVSFQLINVVAPQAPVMLSMAFTTTQSGLRVLAHHISDIVYQRLTGTRGIFSTKIAYVLVRQLGGSNSPLKYDLDVADADGFNPQTLLTSADPIMSPTWTPDGRGLAYVSFEGHEASIYLQNLVAGSRQLVSRLPGINGAPAFSPDGSKLAMVLSVTGNPNIYMFNMNTHKLTQVVNDSFIDTEPAWAPDGGSVVFTSDRGGTAQIYRYYFAGNRIERITFDGNYNARPSFLPNGKSIIMMHRETGTFGIARQDLDSGIMQSLTQGNDDESPSVAPNGKMVIYATQLGGRGVLAVVSTDGRIKLRLPSRDGNVQEPAWSPFM